MLFIGRIACAQSTDVCVHLLGTLVSCAKMPEPIEMPFEG